MGENKREQGTGTGRKVRLGEGRRGVTLMGGEGRQQKKERERRGAEWWIKPGSRR